MAPNWTTAAGAVEGVLEYVGQPLPRHAIMGLTGHAWHLCITSSDGVHVLPDGPVNLDWEAMVDGYSRTGTSWERFALRLAPGGDWAEGRDAAVEWAIERIDDGRPVVAWDVQLHEFGTVYGYDRARGGFLAHTITSEELGPFTPWEEWPSSLGVVELFAPMAAVDADPTAAVMESLRVAVAMFEGAGAAERGGAAVSGSAALGAWADYFEGEEEIDRAGNAYNLAVLQAARSDGIAFLEDVSAALPDLAIPLAEASRALEEETRALSPLITLFPFPAGGHGNVANPGLRRGAAMALRRAGRHEEEALRALKGAVGRFQEASNGRGRQDEEQVAGDQGQGQGRRR